MEAEFIVLTGFVNRIVEFLKSLLDTAIEAAGWTPLTLKQWDLVVLLLSLVVGAIAAVAAQFDLVHFYRPDSPVSPFFAMILSGFAITVFSDVIHVGIERVKAGKDKALAEANSPGATATVTAQGGAQASVTVAAPPAPPSITVTPS